LNNNNKDSQNIISLYDKIISYAMKKLSILAAAMLFAFSANAQVYVESHSEIQPKTAIRPDATVLLYPDGQSGKIGIVENGVNVTNPALQDNELRGEETVSPDGNRGNIGEYARMDLYLPEACNGKMVIVCPGGGYSFVSSFNEGAYAAKWFYDRGIAVCVLKYRMPNVHPTVPLDDFQNAIRYCRHHAAGWGVSLIGAMGASAGGHLAACASTMFSDDVTRPDFTILLYPRLTLKRGEPCGTKDNLLGKDANWPDVTEHLQALSYWSPESHVTAQTPPAFIVLSSDDKTVPATNPVPYYTRLIYSGVKAEMHVYPEGGHGWGFSAEKYVGEGKDRFVNCRQEFETALARWLAGIK